MKSYLQENEKPQESGKKIQKIDPDKDKGAKELIVLTVKTKNSIIEATIREGTNIQHLSDLIALIGDFKSGPKKFKEIF